jgi:hypothetical protein
MSTSRFETFPRIDADGTVGDLWLINSADWVLIGWEDAISATSSKSVCDRYSSSSAIADYQEQVVKLEKLNRFKEGFIDTVSYELRSPLSNIRVKSAVGQTCFTVELPIGTQLEGTMCLS